MALWRVVKKDVMFYTLDVEAETKEEADCKADETDLSEYNMEPADWGLETVRIEKICD